MIRAKVMAGALTLEISGDKWPLFVSCLKKMKGVPSEADPDAIRVFNEVMEEINGILRKADEAVTGRPTVEELCTIRGVGEWLAEKILELIASRSEIDVVMHQINEWIGQLSVELFGDGETVPRYSYCDKGSTDEQTVVFDHYTCEYMVSSFDELWDNVDAAERDRQEILRDV